MKVTTDGCLFGAVVAQSIQSKEPENVLDIGLGTGLLSLMVAQQTKTSRIQGIEVEENAFQQASDNLRNSPWNNRLRVHHTSLQSFETQTRFDLIICNPPFFSNNPTGKSGSKNLAVHNEMLSLEDLAFYIFRLLAQHGKAWVMYPAHEMNQFVEIMDEKGLHPEKQIQVLNSKSSTILRTIVCFSESTLKSTAEEQIIIRDDSNEYTAQFVSLLRPYYLHL